METAELRLTQDIGIFNISETLRTIADNIERGTYGESFRCAVVLESDQIETFFMGPGEVWPNLHYLLTVGAAKLVQDKLTECA